MKKARYRDFEKIKLQMISERLEARNEMQEVTEELIQMLMYSK